MVRRAIGLDFDGFLACGYKVKIKYAEEWFGLELQPRQTKKREFERLARQRGLKITYRDLMDPLNEQHIREYEVPDCAVPVLSRLHDAGFRFPVVTSRNDHDFPYALQFLDAHYKGLIDTVINTRNQPKRQTLISLGAVAHVDDDVDKLLELPGLFLRILYRQPENDHIPNSGLLQVHTMMDLERVLMALRS